MPIAALLRRRDFVGQAGAACMLTCVMGPDAHANESGDTSDFPYGLDHRQWAERVGDRFTVQAGPHNDPQGPRELVLRAVRRCSKATDASRPRHVRDEGYSLVFVSRDGRRIPAATPIVSHPQLGEFPLFVQEQLPSHGRKDVWYEAVFG